MDEERNDQKVSETPDVSTNNQAEGSQSRGWRDGLKAEHKDHELASKYTKVSDFYEDAMSWYDKAKQYDSTQQAVVDGVPQKPEDYKLDQVENGNQDLDNWFRKTALELGLSQEKARALYNKWNEEGVGIMSAPARETAAQAAEKGKEVLQKEWGHDYQKNLSSIRRLNNVLFDDDFKSFLDQSHYGSNPNFLKGMLKLSQAIDEDSIETGKIVQKPKKRPGLQFKQPME